jgi:hypothetical protein
MPTSGRHQPLSNEGNNNDSCTMTDSMAGYYWGIPFIFASPNVRIGRRGEMVRGSFPNAECLVPWRGNWIDGRVPNNGCCGRWPCPEQQGGSRYHYLRRSSLWLVSKHFLPASEQDNGQQSSRHRETAPSRGEKVSSDFARRGSASSSSSFSSSFSSSTTPHSLTRHIVVGSARSLARHHDYG